jgi:hypothetical protein
LNGTSGADEKFFGIPHLSHARKARRKKPEMMALVIYANYFRQYASEKGHTYLGDQYIALLSLKYL